jgi:hypothetical protein
MLRGFRELGLERSLGVMGAKGGLGVVAGTKSWETEDEETIEKLLAVVRREMDAEVGERMSAFEGRADAMCREILARYEWERQRGTWAQRVGRWVANMGAAVWNSRAVRLLVP